MMEMKEHEQNIMVTLTFNDVYYPDTGKLDNRHVQDFMKRFRKSYDKLRKGFERQTTYKWKYPDIIRYFCAGEYGSDGRAHYHLVIFGLGPEWKENLWRAWSVDSK